MTTNKIIDEAFTSFQETRGVIPNQQTKKKTLIDKKVDVTLTLCKLAARTKDASVKVSNHHRMLMSDKGTFLREM